jgi:hypothetical protein
VRSHRDASCGCGVGGAVARGGFGPGGVRDGECSGGAASGQAHGGPVISINGVPIISLSNMPSACRALAFQGSEDAFLPAHGYHGLITYQPAGRYWASQGIETGIFVLLAAVLVAVTAIAVLRRDG